MSSPMPDGVFDQEEYVVFRKADYVGLMGELALPPWWDEKRQEYVGGSIDCAALCEQITKRTEETRLHNVRVDDSATAGVRGAITPDELARYFHDEYERMAPEFSYKTREASAVPWEDVPDENKSLMNAVCASVLLAFFPDRMAIRFAADTEDVPQSMKERA